MFNSSGELDFTKIETPQDVFNEKGVLWCTTSCWSSKYNNTSQWELYCFPHHVEKSFVQCEHASANCLQSFTYFCSRPSVTFDVLPCELEM
ncbi:hypothetical protein RDI58_022032 [Solanum bulbocastanum]|uniref:Uncharacterized protein n=1 Tax=Solanum bulbocastanum TaxID=147425 RepID=A0AAN8Y7Q1_SOLBU